MNLDDIKDILDEARSKILQDHMGEPIELNLEIECGHGKNVHVIEYRASASSVQSWVKLLERDSRCRRYRFTTLLDGTEVMVPAQKKVWTKVMAAEVQYADIDNL
jgi:hypothetical protein